MGCSFHFGMAPEFLIDMLLYISCVLVYKVDLLGAHLSTFVGDILFYMAVLLKLGPPSKYSGCLTM